MTQEAYNAFAAYGIGLTFIASIAAVIVSVFSMLSSKKTAKHTDLLNTITAGREKWSAALREVSANYFAQISRLCGGIEKNLPEILSEFTKCHFAISLLIFEKDKVLHDSMGAIRNKACEIVSNDNHIKQQYQNQIDNKLPPKDADNIDSVIDANTKIRELRASIINVHQSVVFNEIRRMLEDEWRKQQDEAGFWRWLEKKQND